jgi:hypothetical protein
MSPSDLVPLGWPLLDTQLLLVHADTGAPLALIMSEHDCTVEQAQHELEGNDYVSPEQIQELLQEGVARQGLLVIPEARLLIGGSRRRCTILQHDPTSIIEGQPVGGPQSPPAVGVASSAYWRDTGDLVRLVDDKLIYLSRIDGTSKIFGKRLHTSEVSQLLKRAPGVVDAAAWTERGVTDEMPRLYAAVHVQRPLRESDDALDVHSHHVMMEMRRWERSAIPDFMRPFAYLVLFVPLPVTVHGKVDTRMLSDMMALQLTQLFHPPLVEATNENARASVRSALSRAWQSTLPQIHYAELSDDASFMSFGASSLDVVRCADVIVRSVAGLPSSSWDVLQALHRSLFDGNLMQLVDCVMGLQTVHPAPSSTTLPREEISMTTPQLSADMMPMRIDGVIQRGSCYSCHVDPSSKFPRMELQWRVFMGKCIDASPLVLLVSPINHNDDEVRFAFHTLSCTP